MSHFPIMIMNFIACSISGYHSSYLIGLNMAKVVAQKSSYSCGPDGGSKKGKKKQSLPREITSIYKDKPIFAEYLRVKKTTLEVWLYLKSEYISHVTPREISLHNDCWEGFFRTMLIFWKIKECTKKKHWHLVLEAVHPDCQRHTVLMKPKADALSSKWFPRPYIENIIC